MPIAIQDNTLARHIAKRRWMRRLNWFALPKRASIEDHGRAFYVDLSDWRGPSYHVLDWGLSSYEPGNLEFLVECLKQTPEGVLFDIGANIGIFPFQLARTFPQLTIHAFEPEQNTFDCLKATFSQPGFPNVHIHRLALSDKKGQAIFYADADNHGGHSLNSRAIADEGNAVAHQITIETDTLDSYMLANNIERLDVIKLDVQRHESEVLAKSHGTIERCRPIVLMECYFTELLEAGSKLLSPFLGKDYLIMDPDTRLNYAIDPAALKDLHRLGREYRDLAFIPTEKAGRFKKH